MEQRAEQVKTGAGHDLAGIREAAAKERADVEKDVAAKRKEADDHLRWVNVARSLPACACSASPSGWRDERPNGGVVPEGSQGGEDLRSLGVSCGGSYQLDEGGAWPSLVT